MAFHVRDPSTDTMVRELARMRGVGLTEAIKLAVGEALRRDETGPSYMDEVRKLQARIAARGRTGLVADKAFFDELSGQGEEE